MFNEISLCRIGAYNSIMMHSKLHLILLKNGHQENGTETLILAKNIFHVHVYVFFMYQVHVGYVFILEA